MQTFLPYSDFYESAKCLDPSRLGNQVYREARTLINGGWPNHPIAKIWANHKHTLAKYGLACLQVLKERGRYYPHHIEFFEQKLKEYPDTGLPDIIGDEEFHASHRSNLLRKNKEWYGKFGWKEPDNLPYKWIK